MPQPGFQHSWDDLNAYAFPPFVFFIKYCPEYGLLKRLSLVLIAPLWPQKEWYANLLDLLVDEPLELPLLWNLLVQLYVRKFHHSLETLRFHVWRLSSVLSKRLAFFGRGCGGHHCIPQGFHSSALNRESGLDFFIDVVDGISPCKATVQQIAEVFLYLLRALKLSVPAVKGYHATLNHVLSLVGVDLAASRINSRVFCSFEKFSSPHEVRPTEWNISLILRNLTCPSYEPLDKHLTWRTWFLSAVAST